MSVVEVEGQWMASLDVDAKAKFLAWLSHELTIVGRGASYEVGTDGLTRPELLRHVNEIQHRVSACLSQLLHEDSHLRAQTLWAYEDALKRIGA